MGDSVDPSVRDFQMFYRDWITRLKLYLYQLLSFLQFQDHENESKPHVQQLVHSVKTHYHDYFLVKAQLSSQNVFLVLSPPWLSSYERTFLWLAGFKPCVVINGVNSCGIQLSKGQSDMMDRLTAEIKNEENAIAKRLARFEQQVVAPPMLAFSKIGGKEVNAYHVLYLWCHLDNRLLYLTNQSTRLANRGKTVAKVVGNWDTKNGSIREIFRGYGSALIED
nr:protein DOG1-like 4 [Tanacetum cinerariifolium]